ncbi:MAG: bifunctional diguanylate cyclase/phosphodiesterase [Hyphomicrobiales bacterium]|nr:MAG: bifunctional diguanylate cyclase/phosphodiesterase [Hyphomicrobiales bacterium]
MRIVACVAGLHNLWLVLLAAGVCVMGSWVGLELYRRSRERQDRQRLGWIVLASIATGSAVWCTHFIAMLAYEPGVPVTFDPSLTFASLMIMIMGAAAAYALGQGPQRLAGYAGGALLGASVAAMHYTGMLAYHVDGIITWDAAYVAASVTMAAVFAALALEATGRARPLVPLALFVLAVVSLHFTGITAVTVTPFVTGYELANPQALAAMAVAIAGVAMLIVGTGVASYLIDSDASERNLDALRHMALNDSLTGLPNRTSFNSFLNHKLERARIDGYKVAVIGIDLDKFKEINDIRGHDAGDQALRAIGERLKALRKDGEFVARMGGDEFAAVKRFQEQRDLIDFLSRVETELFKPLRIDEAEVQTGASIGVSVCPDDGDTAARLIGNADLAMYRAKADLTRSVCFYESDMDELVRARRDLAADLRRAIELDQLELHFQPQSSVSDRKIVGHEVLLRWKHPGRGYVPPAEFIPLAEETGIIIPIGEWVLREACKEAASWKCDDKIAVNLSAVQLTQVDLPKTILAILMETGLPPRRLELEITESSIIQDKVRSLQSLRQIRALGVSIAIDDFGTGYSSLETLRSFPFDRIKLDRSFMNEVEHSVQARAIIRAVLALGRSLDISVLAEGVESELQLQILEDEGCHEAQGYHLGRPTPVAQVRQPEEPEAKVA